MLVANISRNMGLTHDGGFDVEGKKEAVSMLSSNSYTPSVPTPLPHQTSSKVDLS